MQEKHAYPYFSVQSPKAITTGPQMWLPSSSKKKPEKKRFEMETASFLCKLFFYPQSLFFFKQHCNLLLKKFTVIPPPPPSNFPQQQPPMNGKKKNISGLMSMLEEATIVCFQLQYMKIAEWDWPFHSLFHRQNIHRL